MSWYREQGVQFRSIGSSHLKHSLEHCCEKNVVEEDAEFDHLFPVAL